MIKKISIKNFKSLKDIQIELTSLNILAGLNGSGKSSLVQTLLLLRQSLGNGDTKGLVLQGGSLISLGTGKDIFYQYAGNDEYVEFSLEDDKANCFGWKFQYEMGSDILPLLTQTHTEAVADFNLFSEKFQYLNTEHLSSSETFPRSETYIKAGNIGPKGEYAVHYLAEYGISKQVEGESLRHQDARSSALIHQADAWIGEISPGVKLVAEDIKGMEQVRLAFKFETRDSYTNEIKPVNTGFGISYVLPVVVAVLKAQRGDLVVIENPESHLHPRGQSVLGRMIAGAAQNGVQFIVETHSDHFINGLRVAVKNGMPPSMSRIFYFDRVLDKVEQYSEVTEIRLDRNGELSSYPKGFLDEWNEQLMHLI